MVLSWIKYDIAMCSPINQSDITYYDDETNSFTIKLILPDYQEQYNYWKKVKHLKCIEVFSVGDIRFTYNDVKVSVKYYKKTPGEALVIFKAKSKTMEYYGKDNKVKESKFQYFRRKLKELLKINLKENE